jgi:predicted O-methyltransferase YrrM
VLPELLERIYRTGKVEAADGGAVDALPTGVPRAHAEILSRLVRDERAERTLEVGMAFGLSTLAIAGPHGERGSGSHVAVDPFQSTDWRSIGVLNVRRAGLEPYVRVIEEPSDVALPRLAAEGAEVDVAFIDGLHLFDTTLVDFFYADRMLRVGGVVVLHDTWMPAVDQALSFIVENRAYDRLPEGDGAVAVLRKRGADDRAWDFHSEFLPEPTRRAALARLFSKGARTTGS